MRFRTSFLCACLAAALATGCAKQPQLVAGPIAPTAFAGIDLWRPGPFEEGYVVPRGPLAGRTIEVERIEDIVLGEKEVVITFDDGPMPGKTNRILDTLDEYGVKATFLMVGQMARAYPQTAGEVAARGHTVGTHTERHANLTQLDFDDALAEIEEGRRHVAAAVAPRSAAPFFRFPYLADTTALRRALADRGIVVIDADIDSKDYFVSTPEQVRDRALARVEQHGSGIILFHDIHARTAAMLPEFLEGLKERDYKVVRLVPRLRAPELLLSFHGG
ncbi:polysaccharide deacetylase family protein [Lutibaculum baratangense]|uniref:Chitooligosaccharide deacetylase n=1 Tax=Lutibaculum baratangense AMV1 TaxID=631454 RepID=V4TI84_9HYPH|nr:polysaccharide deacetylase family protein [Lutibaculum baratangense]ESR25713.1 putative polysaccharide deacetylase [Lutibaculum baratangense AMV1]